MSEEFKLWALFVLGLVNLIQLIKLRLEFWEATKRKIISNDEVNIKITGDSSDAQRSVLELIAKLRDLQEEKWPT